VLVLESAMASELALAPPAMESELALGPA
jgi:hypothetical protein